MKSTLCFFALFTLLGTHLLPAAPDSPEFTESVQTLEREFPARLARSRYMAANPKPVAVPGWENFPTTKCTYTVKDKATGESKTVSVVMLNPDAHKLARWIVTACLDARGSIQTRDTEKLVDHIMTQSGAQFPVRGIVYEDILPANGLYEIYCFMDGVTVKIKGVPHRGERQPTSEEVRRSLEAPQADVTWVGTYARIQSTTREQYQKAGGRENVEGIAWLDVSRKLYQQAWHSDRNELMIAWAKASL